VWNQTLPYSNWPTTRLHQSPPGNMRAREQLLKHRLSNQKISIRN
jgi:hypothetical protein